MILLQKLKDQSPRNSSSMLLLLIVCSRPGCNKSRSTFRADFVTWFFTPTTQRLNSLKLYGWFFRTDTLNYNLEARIPLIPFWKALKGAGRRRLTRFLLRNSKILFTWILPSWNFAAFEFHRCCQCCCCRRTSCRQSRRHCCGHYRHTCALTVDSVVVVIVVVVSVVVVVIDIPTRNFVRTKFWNHFSFWNNFCLRSIFSAKVEKFRTLWRMNFPSLCKTLAEKNSPGCVVDCSKAPRIGF